MKDKEKQVSILSKEIRDSIDKEELDGLCLPRFYENLVIQGLSASELSVGERLKIGETIQEVTIIGKKCFKECKLAKAREKCSLSNSVIFTRVIKGGSIKIYDEVSSLGL